MNPTLPRQTLRLERSESQPCGNAGYLSRWLPQERPLTDKKDYWFPPRTYGWGWGLPNVWQGWLGYGVAAFLVIATVLIFPLVANPALFQICVWSVVLLLVAVCWIKGEPPSWRWGK